MNGGNAAGDNKRFEVHEARDGQPTLRAGGTRNLKTYASALEKVRPKIKLNAKPGVEENKRKLHGVADGL